MHRQWGEQIQYIQSFKSDERSGFANPDRAGNAPGMNRVIFLGPINKPLDQ